MRNKLGYIVLVLLIAQLALILLSWLLTAAFPELPMWSMLSSESIRWFLGSFVSNQLSPLPIYFITAVVAAGTCVRSRFYIALRAVLLNMRSGLTNLSNNRYRFHYYEKIGLYITLVEFIAYMIVIFLLTAISHAILLSVTGQLLPGSFSPSFIPSLLLVITIMSLTYGMASGTIDSVIKMHRILVGGLEVGSKFTPTYAIGIQLYMSVTYVFIL